MDNSFTSPEPTSNNASLVCPSAPRRHKPSATFDGKHIILPLFFPGSCSILGTNESSVIEMNDDPDLISNRPVTDFTLKNRRTNSEVPIRKILIQDFPTLPFSFPAPVNQVASAHPASMALPRASSDPNKNKLRSFERRRSSITNIELRHTSFNARCA